MPYDTYDVTPLLTVGDNVLGVMLGDGMYNVEGVKGRYTKFIGSFGQPSRFARLTLDFADGNQVVIASDARWTTRPALIVFSSAYGGEDHDARRRAGRMGHHRGRDGGLVAGARGRGAGRRAEGQRGSTDPRRPGAGAGEVTQPAPGVFVYDLGENFSGRPHLVVRGPAGATVKLLPGELLDEQGRVTQRSANARPGFEASFSYTLAGRGEESWRPRFSYYGFRYVEVTGAAPEGRGGGEPVLLRLEGEFLHADLPVDRRLPTAATIFSCAPIG